MNFLISIFKNFENELREDVRIYDRKAASALHRSLVTEFSKEIEMPGLSSAGINQAKTSLKITEIDFESKYLNY